MAGTLVTSTLAAPSWPRHCGGCVSSRVSPSVIATRASAKATSAFCPRLRRDLEAIREEAAGAEAVVVDVEAPLAGGVAAVEHRERVRVGPGGRGRGPDVTGLVVRWPVTRGTAQVGGVAIGHRRGSLVVPAPAEGRDSEGTARVRHQHGPLPTGTDQQQVEVIGALMPDAVDVNPQVRDHPLLGGERHASAGRGSPRRHRRCPESRRPPGRVLTVSVQPISMSPLSLSNTSTAYSSQMPLASLPLNAPRLAA